MSALDFGGGSLTNTTRFASGSAPGLLSATTGYGVGIWLRHSTSPGAGCLFGAGADTTASSFQLRAFTSEYGVNFRDASGANVTARAAFPAAGDYLLYAQYSATLGNIQLFLIAKGATVSGASDSSSAAFADIVPTTGWSVGGDGTTYGKTPLGEAFVINRLLSNAELTLLARGTPITVIEPSPQFYYRFRNGPQAIEANIGTAANADLTLAGSGYTTAADFFVDGNPETIHREARRPPRRSASDKGIDLSGWLSPSNWLDPLAANATNTPVTITTTTGDATAAGATALIDQKRVIATTTGDATAGGPTARINNARVIATSTGNAVANGATAQIDQQRKISTITGNAAADGTTAQINQARTIATTTGDAVANGVTAQVGSNLTVTTSTGNAVADGVTAKINQARVISTATGNAVADGATARIDQQRVIQTTTGDAAAGGPTALINNARTIQTSAGNAVADGATARVDQARTIQTTTGDAVANGITASISGSVVISTIPGNAVADGVPAQIIVGPDLLATTPPTIGGSGAEQEDEADVATRGAMVAQVITALIAAGVLD